jgi:hypothetical protein
MQLLDARMQRYRSPQAPASAFRWVPVRWWDPTLYVGEGQKYRIWAIRSWWLAVAFFVAGVIASEPPMLACS